MILKFQANNMMMPVRDSSIEYGYKWGVAGVLMIYL
jgi:hypothetical protein